MEWWYLALGSVGAAVLGLYLWATWNNDTFRKRGVPHMTPTPFLGTMASFWFGRESLADHSRRTYNSHRNAPLVGYFDFWEPSIMIRDPALIRILTTKDFDHFVDHRPFVQEEDDPLFGKNVFSLTGSKWRRMRSILTPAFTSSKMKAMFGLVSACGKQLGDHLEEVYRAGGGDSATLDMADLFSRTSTDIVATSAFGIHCDSLRERDNQFYSTGKEAMDFSGANMLRFLGSTMFPSLMKMLNFPTTKHHVNEFFQTLVQDAINIREREGIVRPDMIHLLMQARKGTLKDDDEDADKDTGNKEQTLTLEVMTAQAFIFFFGGFDTSSTHLCFLSQMLAQHPDVQRRVQAEVDAVLREEGGALSYEGVVHRMKYLDAVISETLRLWPPVLEMDRVCVKAYTIPASESMPAVDIPEGQALIIPVYALQRDPKYFPDPERFDPERFSEENKPNINPFAYLPFGTGPRACIALRFALMATKITMISILSRFDLEVTSRTQIPLVFQKNTFNTAVEGGFWLAIRPRRADH